MGTIYFSPAQDREEKITVRGFVVDSESATDLHGVHIYVSQQHGTISDRKGFFAIELVKKDTLTFSRIGYQTKRLIIKDGIDWSAVVISLKPGIYILDTVDIMTDYYSNSWMIKPERQPVHIEGISQYIDPSYNKYEPGTLKSLQSPADALYRMFSKRYKEEKRVHYLKKAEEAERELQERAYFRIDEVLEMNNASLPDEKYDSLIKYCGVDYYWLTQVNDYELYMRLNKCVQEFLTTDE